MEASGVPLLVTGAAGFIGSHVCAALGELGFRLIAVDNFKNSSPEALRRVKAISASDCVVVQCDVRDKVGLAILFRTHTPVAVLHFAGLKSVRESVANPIRYFDYNVAGTITLIDLCLTFGCTRFVFSSSACVYRPMDRPLRESDELAPQSPYGLTKLACEQILGTVHDSVPSWSTAILRYFNPVGAHRSGQIGEDPRGVPNNLMPLVCQVAAGRRPFLEVFGCDWPTPDGTPVRDYIHIADLVDGHIAALTAILEKHERLTLNLGTGRGYSVLEVIDTFERVNSVRVPVRMAGRRPGDVATLSADASLALRKLGWQSRRTLEEMCVDHWNWVRHNPSGYCGASAVPQIKSLIASETR